MISLIKKMMKSESEKFKKKHKSTLNKIEKQEPFLEKLSDDELREKTEVFKARLGNGETLDQLLPEAFAVVRETSKRVLGMRHFPVQLLGGIALHEGKIAEMKTGEGKTLVATLPTYLNALEGKGVHVVTVNDYLTERDYTLNKPLFDFLGLSMGYVTQSMTPDEKREAYQKDITYVVNSQLGFDYLNDQRAMAPEQLLQRGLHYCIVDEVDSILLDEARTPLIISQSDSEVSKWVPIVDMIVKGLNEDEYQVEEKTQSASLTEKGVEKVERILRVDNLMDDKHVELAYTIRQALLANYVFRKDKHYLVQNDMVELIDENTGRVSKGRRYSNGLHQAIEAKEGVTVQKESVTLASITYQYLFGYYTKKSGMTGTAITEEEEFYDVYRLEVVAIPTNKPINRTDHPDLVYSTYKKKIEGIIKDVKACYEKGQPVLIGVSTIEQSEEIDKALTRAEIPHDVLNAKNHEREAQIIANAGQKQSVTVATNMAGRGTDIKLGEGVKDVGGLKVIGTERNMNRRVDNQLRGRSGRQGDVGESRFHVSLDDELMKVFGTDKMKSLIELLGSSSGNKDGVVENEMLSSLLDKTQMMIEGNHFDSRKQTIEYDGVLNTQREIIYQQRRALLTNEASLHSLVRYQLKEIVSDEVNAVFKKKKVIETDDYHKLIKDFHRKYTDDIYDVSIYASNLSRGKDGDKKSVIQSLTSPLSELIEERLYAYERADEYVRKQIKSSILSIVDKYWRQHLIEVDEIKKGIHLVGYVGEQPVQAYLERTSDEFDFMTKNIQQDMFKYFIRTQLLDKKEETLV